MTVVTRLTDNFTDPSGLPVMLHGVGVTGASGRWLPADITSLVNNPVGYLDSHPVGQQLQPVVPVSGAPTLRSVSGIKVVEFDGTDDALLGGYLPGTILTPFRTITAVVRRVAVAGTGQVLLSGGTPLPFYIGVDPSNEIIFNWNGGAITVGAPWADTLWHFVGWSGSPTDQVGVYDGNVYTNTGDTATAGSNLWLGSAGYAPVYGNFQIAEVTAWPTALSSGQMATVREAMQDRYATALGL